MKINIFIILSLLIALTTFLSGSAQTRIVAPCPNSSIKAEVKIEEGDIKFITCAGKKVYVNGTDITAAGGSATVTDATNTTKGKVLLSASGTTVAVADTDARVNEHYNAMLAPVGATGNGLTDDAPALNNLIASALTTKGGKIYFPNVNSITTDYLIAANLTFPKNTRLEFAAGARLKVADGITVTMPKPETGATKIFNLQGTGKVVFNNQITAIPQWWGAVDNATNIQSGTARGTDDTIAIQQALTALNSSGGGTLDVASVSGFLIAGSLNLDGFYNIHIVGRAGNANGFNLIFSGAPTNLISARSVQSLFFDRVGIYHTSDSFTGNMLYIGSTGSDSNLDVIRGCTFSGRHGQDGIAPTANAGIGLTHTIDATIEKNNFLGLVHGIASSGGYANVIKVTDNQFVYLQSYAVDLTSGAESWNIEQNTFEGGSNDAIGKGLNRALRIKGSAWSINFSHNWIGDSANGLAADDPFVNLTNTYSSTVNNNRFANYTGTMAWGVSLDGCYGTRIANNRFDGTPGVIARSSYSYHTVLEANENATAQDLSYLLDYSQINDEGTTKFNRGFTVSSYMNPTNDLSAIDFGYIATSKPNTSGQIAVLDSAFGQGVGNRSLGIFSPVNGETEINFFTANLRRGFISSYGLGLYTRIIFPTDNTYDVGTAGAIRPRTGYFGTSVVAPVFAASASVTTPLLNVGSGTNISRITHGRCILKSGVCTVSNSNVTANTNIFVQRQIDGGKVGASYSISRTAGTSFTLTSMSGAGSANTADTSTLAWQMLEP